MLLVLLAKAVPRVAREVVGGVLAGWSVLLVCVCINASMNSCGR